MEKETYMRAARYAAELAGGYEALAERLGVSAEALAAWAEGAVVPSTTAYLFLLDFIVVEVRRLSDEAMAHGLTQLVLAKARHTSKAA